MWKSTINSKQESNAGLYNQKELSFSSHVRTCCEGQVRIHVILNDIVITQFVGLLFVLLKEDSCCC